VAEAETHGRKCESFGLDMMLGPEANWVAELFAARPRLCGALTPVTASADRLWTGAISPKLVADVVTLTVEIASPATLRQHIS
jgi:hypothetical protein